MHVADYHRAQAEHHAAIHDDPSYALKAAAWLDKSTTDYWRHDRMRRTLAPLLRVCNDWLTVGDGRYGADAAWLIEQGQQVVASDIQSRTLAAAAEAGVIRAYAEENAEALSFDSESFDWVLCKESYHHMPRAPSAFYEMLRVARKGIVLIEPIEPEPEYRRGWIALSALRLLRPARHSFEPSGNYLFSLSRREVEKMMLGIGLKTYAFQHLSDLYIEGTESERDINGPLRRKILRRVAFNDFLKRLAGLSSQIGVFVIFKNDELPPGLEESGFRVTKLPENPYLPGPTKP